MKKLFKVLGIIAIALIIGFSITGCDNPSSDNGNDNQSKSSVATLRRISIKGVNAPLGTPSSTLGSEMAGTVDIPADSTGNVTGTATNSTATLTKIVKFASTETNYASTFAAKTAYNNETIADGDFFIFLVTAEDGSKLYYRVNVTIVVQLELTVTGLGNANNSLWGASLMTGTARNTVVATSQGPKAGGTSLTFKFWVPRGPEAGIMEGAPDNTKPFYTEDAYYIGLSDVNMGNPNDPANAFILCDENNEPIKLSFTKENPVQTCARADFEVASTVAE